MKLTYLLTLTALLGSGLLSASVLEEKPAILNFCWNGIVRIESENAPGVYARVPQKDMSVEEIVKAILEYRCNPVYIRCDKGADQKPDRADVQKAKAVQEKLRNANVKVSEIVVASSGLGVPGSDWRTVLDIGGKIYDKKQEQKKRAMEGISLRPDGIDSISRILQTASFAPKAPSDLEIIKLLGEGIGLVENQNIYRFYCDPENKLWLRSKADFTDITNVPITEVLVSKVSLWTADDPSGWSAKIKGSVRGVNLGDEESVATRVFGEPLRTEESSSLTGKKLKVMEFSPKFLDKGHQVKVFVDKGKIVAISVALTP